MLETFHWFRGEGFTLLVEDLVRLSADTGVMAEGIRLLPHLVKPLLADPRRAVWLLPTPQFRVAAVDTRSTGWEFLRKTSDPGRARLNLLDRDRMFTDELLEETKRLELATVQVDIGMTEDELASRVTQTLVCEPGRLYTVGALHECDLLPARSAGPELPGTCRFFRAHSRS